MDTSYLTTQVNTIVGQLHGIFDEIGIPRNERESRETEVCYPQLDVHHGILTIYISFLALYRRPCTITCELLIRELAIMDWGHIDY